MKSIDDKRLQSSFYERLIYIKRYFNLFIEKKIVQFLHLYSRYYLFNWSSLQECRSQAKAIMMYQIVYQLYQLLDIPSTILIPTILSKREYHQLHCVVSQDYKISEI